MKQYKITKTDITTEETVNYGICNEEDMKLITRGYHFNGMFYEKKNCKSIYIVEEV